MIIGNKRDQSRETLVDQVDVVGFFRKVCEENYSLLNDVTRWRSCSGVIRGCAPRIRIWPPSCDERSGALIGAGGTRRSDWPKRV